MSGPEQDDAPSTTELLGDVVKRCKNCNDLDNEIEALEMLQPVNDEPILDFIKRAKRANDLDCEIKGIRLLRRLQKLDRWQRQ